MLKGDFHIHSKYSFDSLLSSKSIVKTAKKRGLDVIAVTDHNTIKGAKETSKWGKEYRVEVIIGSEILTDVGDITGLFITDEINSKNWKDTINDIHNQGGLVILPHPFRGHKNIEEIAKRMDLIEVFNSRSSPKQNNMALELAEKIKKGVLAGSDAHTSSEIGLCKISIENNGNIYESIKSGINEINIDKCKYSTPYQVNYSRLVKVFKTREFKKIPAYFIKGFKKL